MQKSVPRNGHYVFKRNQELVIPPVLAFADDLTLLCRSEKVMHNLLVGVDEFCNWSRCLAVKPSKCRYLCLARRNTVFGPINPVLITNGQAIKEIHCGSPFKFLGKYFESQCKPDVNHAINVGFRLDLKKVGCLP